MRIIKNIIRSLKPKPKNVRVKNLVYDMTEARQSSKCNPELLHTKRTAP